MVNYLNHYRKIRTERYHGHCACFSPHMNDILAVVGAENFGIKGTGSLIVYNASSPTPIQSIYHYPDAIFDLSWSKNSPEVILTGSGDGCIQLWTINTSKQVPLRQQKLHHKEVSSVEFASSDPDYFSSSSWDSTIALSTANSARPAIILRCENTDIIYEARWSPARDRTLASVSGNGATIVWSPFQSNQPDLVLGNTGAEVLTCDWSFSDPNLLVTGTTRAMIYLWDLRAPKFPLVEMRGHENAIRKVRFNPIVTDEVASVSYDFTTRLWNAMNGHEICATQAHNEFVYGLDFSLLNPGVVVDCSWDRTAQIYKIGPRQDQSFSIHDSTFKPLHQQRIIGNTPSRPLPPLPSNHQFVNPVGHSFNPRHLPFDPFSNDSNKLSNQHSTRPLPPLPDKL